MELMSSSFWSMLKFAGETGQHFKGVVEGELGKGYIDWSQRDLAFDVDETNRILDMSMGIEHRRRVQEFLGTHPIFKNRNYYGLPLDEQRELLQKQLITFVESGLLDFRDSWVNPSRWASTLEPLVCIGGALATKAGVHYTLFGNTVVNVGSEYHREKYWKDINDYRVRGCFALTELGHGSNARALETEATYDVETDEFVLNTPTDSAQKYFIGNLAKHATHAVVFAQLFVGEPRGVHAFIVDLRNKDGSLKKGIHIMDCGLKSNLNAVDNGRLWLDNKRIPRENLLNRLSQVDRKGQFHSEIESNNLRFTKMIGQLIGGRIGVSIHAITASKIGLAIAVRYGETRRQFGPEHGPEVPLLDYTSHQLLLIPLIAKTYVLNLALNDLKNIGYIKIADEGGDLQSHMEGMQKELHIYAAGLKPLTTWHRLRTLQTCRECCGGQGLMAANIISPLQQETEIDVTWEGANVVLLQQVSGSLLKDLHKRMRGTSNAGLPGSIQVLFEHAMMSLRDKNPVKRIRSDEKHLVDIQLYLNAMEYREARLLTTVAMRLRQAKGSMFDKWNNCLEPVLQLGTAHTERLVLQGFASRLDSLPTIFHVIAALFGVNTIIEDLGFFSTHNYFSARKVRALYEERQRLCSVLRPHARALVDAFGYPDSLLNAPIAGDYFAANARDKVPGSIASNL